MEGSIHAFHGGRSLISMAYGLEFWVRFHEG